MQIYNTITRQKQEFKPITPGKVKMYVCGVTVYDYCHIGHARAYTTFDMIRRYLQHKGFEVTFVRNITDIDDKIINRAKERKIAWNDLAGEFIQAFHEDSKGLGWQDATIEPIATDHIAEMIVIIKNLEAKGLAYPVGGDVFYSVRKFSGYGKLSGKNIEDLESGARVDVMESKTDPLDFALWKNSKPGEPSWHSPWGEGRPGWHIECSAMSMKHLGETFDIHGGGRDLIFPHHENEIAQSEACTGKKFANFWVHNGFVNINSEKMSKSLSNFLLIRDVLKVYPAEVIRLFILSSHYRSPLDYTEKNVTNAATSLERYYTTMLRLKDKLGTLKGDESDAGLMAKIKAFRAHFIKAMDDDFNTAKVVGSIFDWVRQWNKYLDEGKVFSKMAIQEFQSCMSDCHRVLGIFGSEPEDFLSEYKAKHVEKTGVSSDKIEVLIEDRQQAKKSRDFKKSDAIRDTLKEMGVQLKDNPDGTTTWTVM
jgi:cysteinyl-tRNA synthetase